MVLTIGALMLETCITLNRFLIKNNLATLEFKPTVVFKRPQRPEHTT